MLNTSPLDKRSISCHFQGKGCCENCTARREQGTPSSDQEFDGKCLTDKVNLARILLEMLANASLIVYGMFPEVQFVNAIF
jgi:hypothetical protein